MDSPDPQVMREAMESVVALLQKVINDPGIKTLVVGYMDANDKSHVLVTGCGHCTMSIAALVQQHAFRTCFPDFHSTEPRTSEIGARRLDA